MSIKVKKVAFYLSFILSILIVLIKCDRGIPTEVVKFFSISGKVTRQGNPAKSIEVKLEGEAEYSTRTDSIGEYIFADLAEGLYALYPTHGGYEFNPSKMQVELSGMDLEDQNFVMKEFAASLLLLKTELEFGEVSVGSSRELQLGISNLGMGELSLSKFSFSRKEFSTSPSELSIPPKDLDYLTVVFTPQDSAEVTGKLTITTNDPNQPSVTVPLSGSGISKGIPSLVLEPEQLDFGFVRLGASIPLNLVISNEGIDTLRISSITSTNPIFQVETSSAAVPGGKSLTVRVFFTPQDTSLVSAALDIQNNSSNQPSADVPLSGSGRKDLPAGLSISKTEVDYGQVFADSQYVIEIDITSIGGESLLLTAFEIDNNKFSVPFTSTSLDPGETKRYPVSFEASDMGNYQGTLTIYTSDPENTTVKVSLRAEVTTSPPTEIRLNPSLLSFGTVVVGLENNRSFWVVNPTGFILVVKSIITSRPSDFGVGVESLQVNPMDSTRVTVTFSPQSEEQFAERVVLSTNVVGADTVAVELIGEGGEAPKPELELSSTSIDFGAVIVKEISLLNLTVGNKGPGTLIVYAMETEKSFFRAETFTGTLNTGDSRTIELVFEPRTAGVATGLLVIDSNDPAQARAEVLLTGTAIDTTSPMPIMKLSSHELDLGRVILQTTGTSAMTINNIGKETLVVSSISSDNTSFSVTPEQVILLPGTGETIVVSFSPAGEELSQGLILIASNDRFHPFDTVAVSGEGFTFTGEITPNEIYIPGGSFLMGPGSSGIVRMVTVNSFYIDTYEVTNAEYKEFIDAGGYDNSDYWTSEGWHWRRTSREQGFNFMDPKPRFWGSGDSPWESDPYSSTSDSPVVGVSWYEAYAYAKFRERTLATEAQWEYVARSTEGRIYPWGNYWFENMANHGKARNPYYDEADGFKYTAPVGSFPLGAVQEPAVIYDLAGNVWEWCLDWYETYDSGDLLNPQGPPHGNTKVIRGGSWNGSIDYCRAFQRNGSRPDMRYKDVGIRLARTY